ncbi:hypothetical protein L3X38_012829 [Prunus dulcis]|uniref:TIR domain-containing protein n=2 Tax=Prunus dulcis TaxID=3755 RepID=A0AAD4WMD0_PRUDU|nr:hypothetical protein L3X38_012829 [Prunus dulcis]
MALVRAAQQTPSSKAFRCCRYHVFLSFRGKDTRKTFTDHLYTALVNAGFRTFRDDDEVERGEDGVNELVMILEHKRISADHVILPVFYDVDPSDVRKQTGSLAKAFARHQKTQPSNKEKEWREALSEVADLAGMVLQNQGYESKFINKIVQVIGEKLRRRPLNVPHIMTGMHSRVHELNLWLQDGSDDVGILVIYGMSGIGKTTIAKSLYNTKFERFGGSSFIENIREISQQPNGLVQIQKQLLSDILNGRKVKIQSVSEGMTEIQDAISSKRVFLVLDDVDHISQLDVVLGMKDQFYPGSKIIITTRRAGLLKAHQVTKVHAVQTLDNKESLELLSWHAFGRDHPIEDYIEYSEKLVDHCGGLPLALQVLGSSLLGESIGVWKSALEKLKAIPNGEIVNKLRVSYDSLQDDHDRKLFLHIACFFIGKDKDCIVKILDGCDFYTIVGIQNLIDRCLVTIDGWDKVHMHDLIRGMGREIVHLESKEPWKRSKVWHHKDSFKILTEKNGTKTIEEFCTGLRWLCWTKFPLDSIPTEFSLRSLVVLEMRYSSLRQVCKGTKCLPSLKILDLSHSHSLTETTDFSFCPNLEKLILVNCVSLIYGSIGNLERLVYLNMKDCKNLKMLPEDICMLKLLETLIISGCTSLNELSIEMLRNIESLKVLETDKIPLGELRPGRSSCILSSLSCSLVDLSLRGCNLSNDAFPREFNNLSSLRRLNIGDNPICSLPNCIKGLTRLKTLSFSQCKSLKLLEELPKVGTLDVVGCVSLEKITYQSFWSRRHTILWNNRNLVEREYSYKLEPIGSVDAEMINLLGLSNLESMAPIRMRKRMWMSEKDDWNPVQGLYEKGIFSTFFAGNEVPGQFSHKSTKSPISFTVPLLDNHRIQGLKVFVVYTKLYAHHSGRALPGPIITRVKNKSKGLKWIYCPRCYGIPGEGEDMIWLSLWKLKEPEVHLDGSDEVVVSVIMQPWLQVKEFGIQLVQHLQEGNTNMMTVSTDSSYYPSVKSGDSSYQPGVYLLFRRNKRIQDPIWFNKILEDSDDEDTTVKEEEQHYDQTIAVTTGSNESGGLRGWKGKVLISAACFFLTLSLIARSSLSHKKKRQSTSRG